MRAARSPSIEMARSDDFTSGWEFSTHGTRGAALRARRRPRVNWHGIRTLFSELIAFKLPKGATRRVRRQTQPATILFFTGVRREIMVDAAPSHCSPHAREDARKPSGKARDKNEERVK